MLFLLLAPDPPVVRELVKNSVHSFRVHLDVSTAQVEEKIDFVIQAKCLDDAKEGGQTKVELKFTDYRFEALDHVKRSKLFGAGSLAMSGTGLPDQLKAEVKDTHVWYPMLTWYLPSEIKEGKFDAQQDLGFNTRLDCKGALKDDEYSMTGDLVGPGATNATINMTWKLSRGGWLGSGSGDVTDSDGTIHFSISKR